LLCYLLYGMGDDVMLEQGAENISADNKLDLIETAIISIAISLGD